MVMTWVARKPDEHLRCWGLRWCGTCGEAAEYREDCRYCHRRRVRASQRRYLQRPEGRAKRNAASKRFEAARRRGDAPSYQRQKAYKRWRYANDPEYRAAKIAAWRRWKASRAA